MCQISKVFKQQPNQGLSNRESKPGWHQTRRKGGLLVLSWGAVLQHLCSANIVPMWQGDKRGGEGFFSGGQGRQKMKTNSSLRSDHFTAQFQTGSVHSKFIYGDRYFKCWWLSKALCMAIALSLKKTAKRTKQEVSLWATSNCSELHKSALSWNVPHKDALIPHTLNATTLNRIIRNGQFRL